MIESPHCIGGVEVCTGSWIFQPNLVLCDIPKTNTTLIEIRLGSAMLIEIITVVELMIEKNHII